MMAGPKKEDLFNVETELSGKFRGLLAQMENPSDSKSDLTDLKRDVGSIELPDFMKKTM
jgi:hypothetical protein